ncbi:MAG: DNA alkylation repair protein [Firmicutes bacterium]|nr:DNA alkylation repair protein [Bacillota bacterium]
MTGSVRDNGTGGTFDRMAVRGWLEQHAEAEYRDFSAGLTPGVQNILGVRLPLLRKYARELIAGDWRGFLRDYPTIYHEEVMLQGMVLAGAPMPPEERLEWLRGYLPRIDNWAVCDAVAASFDLRGEEKRLMWDFLLGLQYAEWAFSRRFMLVMLLMYYLEPPYPAGWSAEDFCRLVEDTPGGEYYVDMARAWLLSVLFVKQRELGRRYLPQSRLDDFTYNKTLRKMLESRRLPAEDREFIRSLRRK